MDVRHQALSAYSVPQSARAARPPSCVRAPPRTPCSWADGRLGCGPLRLPRPETLESHRRHWHVFESSGLLRRGDYYVSDHERVSVAAPFHWSAGEVGHGWVGFVFWWLCSLFCTLFYCAPYWPGRRTCRGTRTAWRRLLMAHCCPIAADIEASVSTVYLWAFCTKITPRLTSDSLASCFLSQHLRTLLDS